MKLSRIVPLLFALAGPAAHAALTVTVPDAILLPDTDNQPVQLRVTGGDLVAGVNLRAVLGNGTAAGAEPVFRGFDFAAGTIFAGRPGALTGGPNAAFPQDAQAGYALSAPLDQTAADGVFVTAYVSTLGLTSGTYPLALAGTEIGAPTTFVASGGATIVPAVGNGTITIAAPEPASLALIAAGFALAAGRSRRRRP